MLTSRRKIHVAYKDPNAGYILASNFDASVPIGRSLFDIVVAAGKLDNDDNALCDNKAENHLADLIHRWRTNPEDNSNTLQIRVFMERGYNLFTCPAETVYAIVRRKPGSDAWEVRLTDFT